MTRSLKAPAMSPQRADASQPLYKRYRFTALATYGAVLVAGIADALSGSIGPNSLVAAPEGLRLVIFLAAILGLIGFDVAAWEADFEAAGKTYGLQGLKETLNLVGGHLELMSAAGQGAKIEVVIPKRGF